MQSVLIFIKKTAYFLTGPAQETKFNFFDEYLSKKKFIKAYKELLYAEST